MSWKNWKPIGRTWVFLPPDDNAWLLLAHKCTIKTRQHRTHMDWCYYTNK